MSKRKSQLTKFYERLPVFLQNAVCTAAGVQIIRSRYNRTFREILEFLDESQWWPLDRLQAYQDEALRKIVRHAYEQVPYYREVMEARRLKPEDIRTTADLAKFPVLEKQTVRNRHADLRARSWPRSQTMTVHTSGTTAKALEIAIDRSTQPWQWATLWRYRRRFGCDYRDPFVAFAGRTVAPLSNMNPPFWRRNLALRQTYVCVHHMTKQNMPALAEYLQRRKVAYYSGYPSAMYLLATHMRHHGISLPHPPRMVFTGAETLLPHHRETISRAFETDVVDHYGAAEPCGYISQCEQNVYHVDMELAVVELLPVDGQPADIRRIVGTSLHNYAMPLIRYNMGDNAVLHYGPCGCGRAAHTIKRIDGRQDAYIITPDGRQLGRLGLLFKQTSSIDEAQLVQTAPDQVIARIVPNRHYTSDDEADLSKTLRDYLGDAIQIRIEHLDTIPRELNGKYRVVVSHLPGANTTPEITDRT